MLQSIQELAIGIHGEPQQPNKKRGKMANITGMDTLCIPMTKIDEDKNFVWYQFKVSVYTDKYAIDKQGRKVENIEHKYGVFKFKKTGLLKDSTIEFIEDKTDQALINNERLIYCCLAVMIRCKRNGVYPENEMWASG